MPKRAFLVLEDGSVYEGYSFGAETTAYGEAVFNTSMTGYEGMLTDPSYAGQIIVPTYPLIGNYGINEQDFESPRIQARGLVVREYCLQPSHWQSTKTLHQFLAGNNIPGVYGVDTRALTRHLRSAGVMMGAITSDKSPQEALEELKSIPPYGSIDFAKQVSTKIPYKWEELAKIKTVEALIGEDIPYEWKGDFFYHIVVVDCGVKYSILRSLHRLGCAITIVPCIFSAEEILNLNPDGILLSPGPGDPALLDYLIKTVQGLVGIKPIMGICLGDQLIAQAFGAKTFKLKFGHHGNHPVRDLETGRVHITAQNHGYAVDADTLKEELEVSYINLNDGTVEGLRHRQLPILSIQYHSEALFEQFLEMVGKNKWGD